MKTIKKLCCVLLVFAVVMSLGVTAFAENKYENSAGLTPVDGTSLTFKATQSLREPLFLQILQVILSSRLTQV